MSSLSWMDFSDHERRQALDLIDQLDKDKETRDELGIGTIRDALAELLFPGTSTIQTRAKYFLFVPWIYTELERRKVPSQRIIGEARWYETTLIEALLKSDDTDGVIGKEAGKALKRLPSNVYWQGLHRWGIRQIDLSQDPYHRSIDKLYAMQAQKKVKTDDGEVLGDAFIHWHAGLPPRPADFPQVASFQLSFEEAGYLRDRILHSVPQTMLAYLVRQEEPFEVTPFPWDLPFLPTFPSHVTQTLDHAKRFSYAIHGAALLYNLMLAEQRKWDEKVEDYTERLEKWWGKLCELKMELLSWDRPEFWQLVSQVGRILPQTQAFVEQWLTVVMTALRNDSPVTIITNLDRNRLLIKNREMQLKRGKARLNNLQALRLWVGESGAGQLNYRWSSTRTIVLDILKGLNQNGNGGGPHV